VVEHVVDAASLGSLYALFALGIAMIFGIMRLVNFAHGELIMVGGYVLVFVTLPFHALTVAVSLLVVVALALLMDRVAFRPVRGAADDTLLVASFAVSFLLQNLAIVLIGSRPRSAEVLSGVTRTVSILGVEVRLLDLVTVALAIGMMVLLGLFLKRTRIGVQMRAAAENFRVARLLGVRANLVIALSFAFSGILAGMAAVILVAQTGLVGPTIGVSPLLAAFTATIIGGLGSLRSAVVGAYVLGAVTVALQVTLPLELRASRDAFVFAALIVILVLRPQGLMPGRSMEVRV
jgi:branched-chain amino acid transport system permease protein